MYICLCNGHRERDIRRAAQAGARCVRTIYEQLGGPPRCGRCLPTAERLIARLEASPRSDAASEACHD